MHCSGGARALSSCFHVSSPGEQTKCVRPVSRNHRARLSKESSSFHISTNASLRSTSIHSQCAPFLSYGHQHPLISFNLLSSPKPKSNTSSFLYFKNANLRNSHISLPHRKHSCILPLHAVRHCLASRSLLCKPPTKLCLDDILPVVESIPIRSDTSSLHLPYFSPL